MGQLIFLAAFLIFVYVQGKPYPYPDVNMNNFNFEKSDYRSKPFGIPQSSDDYAYLFYLHSSHVEKGPVEILDVVPVGLVYDFELTDPRPLPIDVRLESEDKKDKQNGMSSVLNPEHKKDVPDSVKDDEKDVPDESNDDAEKDLLDVLNDEDNKVAEPDVTTSKPDDE